MVNQAFFRDFPLTDILDIKVLVIVLDKDTEALMDAFFEERSYAEAVLKKVQKQSQSGPAGQKCLEQYKNNPQAAL